MRIYAGDLETTTKSPAIAYLSGFVEIGYENTFKHYRNLDDFIDVLLSLDKGSIVYFHNLKFDYSYIFYRLKVNNKYEDVIIEEMITGKEKRVRKVTLKTETGHYIELRDSYALFTSGLNSVMQGFNVRHKAKKDLEYYYEYVPDEISKEMFEYFKTDILGLAEALEYRLSLGYNKLTTSSDGKEALKRVINEMYPEKRNAFSDWFFPNLDSLLDKQMRPYYKGGFTYVNPIYAGKVIKDEIEIFDYNSMYPSVMENEFMPYGQPVEFDGSPLKNANGRLFVVKVIIDWCQIKDNCVPFVVNGSVNSFLSTEYVSEISPEDPISLRTLYFTCVELELFCETYDFGKIKFDGGYYFKKKKGMFTAFIDKFRSMKEEGEGAVREVAKRFLNATYGKFGQSPDIESFESQMVEGIQRFVEKKDIRKRKKSFYLPVAIYTTAYSRVKLLRDINKVGMADFVYCDTDSIHVIGDHSDKFDIDEKRFGALKSEGKFIKSKYLRTKRYAHEYINKDGEIKTAFVCAGIGPKYLSILKRIEEFEEGIAIPVMRMYMQEGGMQPKIIDVSI